MIRLKRLKKIIICISVWLAPGVNAAGALPMEYEAGALTNVSSSRFSPYFIASGRHGMVSAKSSALAFAGLYKPLDMSGRWDYGFGVSFSTGYTASAAYDRYSEAANQWTRHSMAPASAITLRQLFAEIRYRSVVASFGMKNRGSVLYNDTLSSGDFIHSANARPIPQLRISLSGFRPIPFTSGWLELDAAWAIGRFSDSDFMRSQFNHYTYHITTGSYYHYKRMLFRTKPSEAFSVTFGFQSGGQFGGKYFLYWQGQLKKIQRLSESFRTILDVSIPFMGQGGEGFYTGNTLGSWDFKARYRLSSGHNVYAYFQWPWEDGSGMAKRNGWDGIWGLEWQSPKCNIINGAVLEYIDFRHQGGPIHWAPGDHPGTSINVSATGRDDYYNNALYNSYANYGMSLGTPFLLSPLYNTDGYPAYAHNKARGFHVAISGKPTTGLSYIMKFSWQQAWGNGRIPQPRPLYSRSWLAEVSYDVSRLMTGLNLVGALALDNGNLRGNNFGAMLTVRYTGSFTFSKI